MRTVGLDSPSNTHRLSFSGSGFACASSFTDNPQHASQRLRCAPKQLIADGKGAEVLWPEIQLVQTANRNREGARNRSWREIAHGRLLVIGDELRPCVRIGDYRLDVAKWHVLLQLDRQSLAVAAHRADADTDSIYWYRRIEAKNLVGFGHSLPFLFGLASRHLFVDPGQQAAGKGSSKFCRWER